MKGLSQQKFERGLDYASASQVTKLFNEDGDLIVLLSKNIVLFSWSPSYMLSIDIRVVCNRLAIDSFAKPVSQKKCRVGEDKRVTIE